MGQELYGGAQAPTVSMWNYLGRVAASIVMAMVLILGGGVGAASAAPPYATEATVSNIQFVDSAVGTGWQVELTASWSLPDNPEANAGFTIPFPAGELTGRGDTFQIRAQDSGAVIANCVAKATQLECDFDNAYITQHPRNLSGNVNFWVRIDAQVTQTEEHVFVFGSETSTVTMTPPSNNVCTSNCEFWWDYSKDGWYNYQDNTITWWMHVKAGETGMAGGLNVEVRDTPGPNQSLIVNDGMPILQRTNLVGDRGDGWIRPHTWTNAPRSEYTVDADGTVKFVSSEGYFYQVVFRTTVLDNGAAGTYTNGGEFIINGTKDGEASSQIRYAGGGGTGIGTDVGKFSITKLIAGASEGLPAEQAFTGSYEVTTPDGSISSDNFSVTAGETWQSAEYPRNSTVHLTEVRPTEPTNITWDQPAWSVNDFALVGGTLTNVTLTNTAHVKLGTFSASKKLKGTASALASVPSETQFLLDYSYPAGVGFPAGAGTLSVGADGAPVVSAELPVGAEVTLSERTPGAIEGLGWGTPVITPSTFTITEGTAVTVQVTNPVAETLGGFSVKKSVSGHASGLVPAGTVFTVDYVWSTDDGQTGTGTLEVVAGGDAAVVQGIPAGATVTLTEMTSAAIDGVQWLDPVFSENGFTVIAGTVVEIDLDNPTQLRQGAFTIRKVIDGAGASQVAADAEFTVTYAYPAGEGFDGGSGEIIVRADGVLVQSESIPYGATVTLTELVPNDLAGVQWTGGKFNIEEVILGDGTVQDVVLTNTYDTAATKSVSSTPALATTGSDRLQGLGLAVGSALLIAAGAALATRKRAARR